MTVSQLRLHPFGLALVVFSWRPHPVHPQALRAALAVAAHNLVYAVRVTPPSLLAVLARPRRTR